MPTIFAGQSFPFTITDPDGGTPADLVCTSSAPTVASVAPTAEGGVVTAIQQGTCTIYAQAPGYVPTMVQVIVVAELGNPMLTINVGQAA